jgi:hypothetical protein
MSGSGIKDIFPLLSQRLIMGENDRHPTAKSALGIYTPLSKRNPWSFPLSLTSHRLPLALLEDYVTGINTILHEPFGRLLGCLRIWNLRSALRDGEGVSDFQDSPALETKS